MKADTRSFYAGIIQSVVTHIATHLDDALDLDSLARRACLSPFHFHRVFRGMVGETPLELARRLRLERAAWELVRGPRPITAIAMDSGYETHEAFARAFRAAYASSPSEFRQQPHRRTQLAATCGIHFTPDGAVAPFVPRESGGRAMQVEIKEMPSLRVASVRHVGPYNQINEAFSRLGAIAGPAGLFGQKPGGMIALYHDDPESTPASELHSDAGLIVPEGATLPPALNECRLPAGSYACTVHIGPYEGLGDTWARFLGEWLPTSGRRMGATPSYELYVNNPQTTPKGELKTEIYVPLAD